MTELNLTMDNVSSFKSTMLNNYYLSALIYYDCNNPRNKTICLKGNTAIAYAILRHAAGNLLYYYLVFILILFSNILQSSFKLNFKALGPK